jgi:radical SAM protein with 4Fe4S-binding SPASM domain
MSMVAHHDVLRALAAAGLQPPRTLTMAITGQCNLQCGHCLVEAGSAGSAGHVPERTLRRLLTEFSELGGKGICLTGGEPLCHPAWLRLLQYARSLDMETVAIQTNGLLWSKEAVEAIRSLDFSGLTVQVSLDGATAAAHDLVRGKGAFSGVMAGLEMMVKCGLGQQIRLCFTEMRHNLAEFPELLKLADTMGIKSVQAGTLVRTVRGIRSELLVPPDLEQYLDLRQRLTIDREFSDLYERLGSMAALEWGLENGPCNDCCTFVENPYLSSDGRLFPCLFCHAEHYSVSGVHGKSLAAAFREGTRLWEALMEESRRRAAELAACADCSGRQVCGGGCMGRAWATSGEFCSVDDRCHVRRGIYLAEDPS